MTELTAARLGRAGAAVAWLALLCCAAAGGLLILRAAALPEYDDLAAADALRGWSCRGNPECSARWHTAMDEARSAKWPTLNLGIGLCVLAGWLSALMGWYRVGDLRRLAAMRTPRSVFAILAGGSVVWLGDLSAEWVHILRDAARGYYPAWADSILIPLTHLYLVALLLPVPLLTGLALLWRAPLPVSLWLWRPDRPLVFGLATLLFGALTYVAFDYLYWQVRDGSVIGIPVTILEIYVMLSARAAVIARWARPRAGKAVTATP